MLMRGALMAAPRRWILYCPKCDVQHIDEGVWATKEHKTHQCQACGHEWRPFDFPTFGVPKGGVCVCGHGWVSHDAEGPACFAPGGPQGWGCPCEAFEPDLDRWLCECGTLGALAFMEGHSAETGHAYARDGCAGNPADRLDSGKSGLAAALFGNQVESERGAA